jgi:hypothetical protein
MYILFNAFLMALELAAIYAVAWLGYTAPLLFAAVTALAALGLGVALEIARLRNEIPFYFDRPPGRFQLFTRAVASIEAFVKALLAGVVALLTFLGTDSERLFWVSAIFAVTLFLGVQAVRFLAQRFGARPLRWGYFRLAAPLGLTFSIGQAMLPSPGLSELAKRVTFELPERPSLEQGSEFLFLLKQSFDDIVERLLGWVMGPQLAEIASAVVSVNVLSGFVVAIYAVLIADGVRRLEGG